MTATCRIALWFTAVVAAAACARAQSPPPLVTSPQWEVWYQNLLASRLAACPFERGSTYYFSMSGDDATGDGSVISPWKTIAKARQVIEASKPAGDVAVLFKRGDVWREEVGIETSIPNITVGDYGEGPKPLLTAFQVIAPASAWSPTPGFSNTFQRSEPEVVTWVKEDNNLDEPYSRQSSITGVSATEGSWFWEKGVLYIHPKHGAPGTATDPRTDGKAYELVRPTERGVAVSGNGSRIQNIRTQGWGLTVEWGTQMHGIESRVGGSDQCVVVGCEAHYGLAHAMVHCSQQGGFATFVDCKAGLITWSGNEGTMFNTYASLGSNSTIFEGCECTHGTMPSFDRPGDDRLGLAFYGHTDAAPGYYMGLIISNNCRTRDTRYGCRSSGSFSNLTPAGTLGDVRCFFVNEVFEGGPGTGAAFQAGVPNAARVNGRYLNLCPPPLLGGALVHWEVGGWLINCTIVVDGSEQPSDFALFNGWPWSSSRVHIWNSAIHAVTPPGIRFSIDYDSPNQSPQSTLYNTIISHTGGGSCIPNIAGAPGSVLANAYYNVDPAGYAHDPQAVVLATEPPVQSQRPACVSPLSCAAAALPAGITLAFDQSGPVPDRNDIGPLESPPCANCDGSTVAPVLNVNDFVCFSNRFAAGDPAANCDGSTAVPILNVDDFVCFMSMFASGCR